jgi:hypothetical protein
MRNLIVLSIGFLLCACQSAPEAPAEPVRLESVREIDQQFVSMLVAKRLRELDATFVSIAKAYESDPLTENRMDVAVRAFYRPGRDFQPLLDEWVATMPKSYSARLARGVFYTAMGWDRRGSCGTCRTKEEQFRQMREFHAKASADLEAAQVMNPRLTHAFVYRLDVAMAAGDRGTIRAMRDRALAINPLSLTARMFHMTALLPRWGGSIEEMKAEIEAARQYHMKNPALKVLEGRIDAEQADQAYFAGDFSTAQRLYGQVLMKHGPHPFYNRKRAEAFNRLGSVQAAWAESENALRAAPNDYQALLVRASARYGQKDYPAAMADIKASLEGNPHNNETIGLRGRVYLATGDLKAALADFETAVTEIPGYQRYVVETRQKLQQGR